MLHVLARGCPSWKPVPGWQDLGGCWSPPDPPSWWTPPHITLTAGIAVAALAVLAAVRHFRKAPADRQWRRTLGFRGRRELRRAIRRDRRARRSDPWFRS
jgi:hypothetical protein